MTISLLPEGSITETWDWLTDIITDDLGRETRMSLRSQPRISMSASFFIPDYQVARDVHDDLLEFMKVPQVIGLWQYAVSPVQVSPQGTNKIYFDTAGSLFTSGQPVSIINRVTLVNENYTVTSVDSDGIVVDISLTEDVGRSHSVCPSELMIIKNSNFNLSSVTANLDMTFETLDEYEFIGENTTAPVQLLNDRPIMEPRYTIGATENMTYGYEVLDNGVGIRQYEPDALEVQISGTRKFQLSRLGSEFALDYFRNFFDSLKGAWKTFILSTQRSDFLKVGGYVFRGQPNADRVIVFNDEVRTDGGVIGLEITYFDGSRSYHGLVGSQIHYISPSPTNQLSNGNSRKNYYTLTDIPGITEADIDAGRISFHSGFTSAAFTVTGNNPAIHDSYVIHTYLDENFQQITPNGTFTQAITSDDNERVTEVDRVVPAGTRFLQFQHNVLTINGVYFTSEQEFAGYKIDDGVINRIENFYDHVDLQISPGLPDDTKVYEIQRVSYCMKVRMGDSVKIKHTSLDTEVSIEVTTTLTG